MEIRFHRKSIYKALSLAQGATGNKIAQPILSAVLLQADQTGLRCVGTDLECQMVGVLPAMDDLHIIQPGSISVPGRKFHDIIRSLPDDAIVRLVKNDKYCLIIAGGSRFKLATYINEIFPQFPFFEAKTQFTIDAALLKEAIHACAFAMAAADVRYFLNGLLLKIKDSKLTIVATDGHRLAVFEQALPTALSIEVILPRKAVLEIQKMLQDENGSLNVALSDQYAKISTQNYEFITKLIDGKFPDHTQVVPDISRCHRLTVPRAVFKDALTRTQVLISDRSSGAAMRLSNDTLIIAARNKENDEIEEQLTVKYAGPECEIALNVGYILEYLNQIKSEILYIAVQGPQKSVRIEGDQTQGYYVVMPMRL